MKIFEISGGDAREYITLSLYNEELEDLQRYTMRKELQYLDKTPIEINISDGGTEFPDILCQPLPLFSDKLKNLLDRVGVDNVFYKPVYLIDELLEEKYLYWLGVVDIIECFQSDDDESDEERYVLENIGRYMIFRDKIQSKLSLYITEELKNILEDEKNEIEGIRFFEIENKK